MKNSQFHLLIIVVILLFASLIIIETAKTEYLYSFDPWAHLFFAKFAESEEFLSNNVTVHNGSIGASYKSFLRSNFYTFSMVSGVEMYQLVRFGGVFLRIIYTGLVYILILTITNEKLVALFTAIIIYASPYFAVRSYLSFPENFAILFYLLALWAFEKYRATKNASFLSIPSFSFVAAAYIHSKSIPFFSFIIVAYLTYFLIEKKYKEIKHIIISFAVSIVFMLPILYDTFLSVSILQNNINFLTEDTLAARYLPPTFSSYENYLSTLLLVLSIYGLFYIIKNHGKRYLPILILFLLTFILSLGMHLNIFVPADRMQAYLFLPIIMVVGVYLKHVYQSIESPLGKNFLITATVILALLNVQNISPWFPFWHGEIEISQTINELLEIDEEALVSIGDEEKMLLYLIDKPKQVCINGTFYRFKRSGFQQSIHNCESSKYILSKSDTPPNDYRLFSQENDYFLYAISP